MTALNVHVADDAVHLITDGLTYSATDLAAFGRMSKVQLLPWINAAYATAGDAAAGLTLLSGFADMTFDTFDEFVADVERSLRVTTERLRAHGLRQLDNCEIVFGGWSDSRQRFEAYAVATFGDRAKPSFVPRPIAGAYSRPYDATMIGKKFDPARPEETGMALLQTQRGIVAEIAGGVRGSGVGGFGHHTIIRRDEIVSRMIGKWPDIPGQPLEPRQQPTIIKGKPA